MGRVEGRTMRAYRFLIAFLLTLPVCLSAQANSGDDIFTITVAAPVSPQDVQVRYFLNGDTTVQQSASIAKPDESKIVVKTGVENKPAKGFRAILFAPGCQFATVKADDLSSSTRQAQFQCQKLTTTPLHGRAKNSPPPPCTAGPTSQDSQARTCRWKCCMCATGRANSSVCRALPSRLF